MANFSAVDPTFLQLGELDSFYSLRNGDICEASTIVMRKWKPIDDVKLFAGFDLSKSAAK